MPRVPRRTIAPLAWLFLLLSGCAPSPDPAGVRETWLGELRYPGGTALRVVLEYSRRGGNAALRLPDQADEAYPAVVAAFGPEEVRFAVERMNGRFSGRIHPGGTRIEGSWSAGGRSLPLALERVEGVPERPRPQTPRPPFPYDVEELEYKNPSAGMRLSGSLTLPRAGRPCPGVLLISGGGDHNRDGLMYGHRPFWLLADFLSRRGIAVLRVDDRGVGRSTGDRRLATLEDLAGDVLAGIKRLAAHPAVSPGAIGLIGHSEGGMVAPLAASRSDTIAFLVLLAAPGLPGDRYLIQTEASLNRAMGMDEAAVAARRSLQERLFAVLKSFPDPEEARAPLREVLESIEPPMPRNMLERSLERYLSPPFRFSVRFDPGEELEKLRIPVLALFAELDIQVPPEGNREAVAAALSRSGTSGTRVEVLPGLNHLFQTVGSFSSQDYVGIPETLSPMMLERIAEWIRQITR